MKYFTSSRTKNITQKVAAYAVSGVTALSLVAGFSTVTASATDCVRAAHQVVTDSGSRSTHKSGTPGESVSYHVDLLNNDSLGCGLSNFTITIEGLPTGWTVYQGGSTNELVDAQEITGYSFAITSPTNAYNGTFNFAVSVSRTEEPTVINQAGSYTIVGGVDQPQTIPTAPSAPAPTPDTTAPTIGSVSPSSSTTLRKRSAVTFTANVSDNASVQNVEFFVDGAPLSNGAWIVPNTRVSNVVLEVRATDTSGNVTSKFVHYSIR